MGKGDKSRNRQTGRFQEIWRGQNGHRGGCPKSHGGSKNRARRSDRTAFGGWNGRCAPLPSLLQHRGFVPNAPSVTVAPFAPRGVQREEEVSFLFFLLDEGLVHGGGVCYRCTRCYSCTKYDKTKGAGSYFMFLTLKLFYYNYLKIW